MDEMTITGWLLGGSGLAAFAFLGLWQYTEGRREAISEELGQVKGELEAAEIRANEWYEAAKDYEIELAVKNVEASFSAERESRAQGDLQWYRRQLADAQQDPLVAERLGDCAGAVVYNSPELGLRNDVTRGIVASIAGERGLQAANVSAIRLSDSSGGVLAGGTERDDPDAADSPD